MYTVNFIIDYLLMLIFELIVVYGPCVCLHTAANGCSSLGPGGGGAVTMSTGKNAGPSEADLDLLPGVCDHLSVIM